MEQNWNFKELEDIQIYMDRQRYSHSDLQKIYDLYNRVFNLKKSVSSCGKCNVNVLNSLRRKYDEERNKQNQ